jgi:hypothetical protein
MTNHVIPEDLAQFILAKIDSVAQMEALLLLRSKPEEEWSSGSLARGLYITEDQTVELLRRFCDEGFLMLKAGDPPRYQYRPASAELRQMLDRLADVYSKHLLPVTNLIHLKPKTRVREFADAFKLRKDK